MIARPNLLGRDTERLIGASRIVLAGTGLIAPYLDPQGLHQANFRTLVILYGVVAIVAVVTQASLGRPTLAKALHVVDLVFATIMLQSTTGAAFFLILATFCLLSSALQWRWQVALATGAYLLAAYLASVSLGLVNSERMTIRTAYLMLVPLGAAIASLNASATRERLLKLARWSSARYSESEDGVLRVFRHAAEVLDAKEVTVFYHVVDQPRAMCATYKREIDRVESGPSDIWPEDTTCAELRRQAFVLVDADRGLCLTRTGMRRMMDPTPGVALSSRSGVVLTAPFTGDFCNGRLFVAGVARWRWDQIVLVEIVASHVRSRLEGRLLRDRTARITAEIERMRLARDVHDGVLQSLTAARLQLRELQQEAPTLAEGLGAIAAMLQEEQQKLREFVEQSRSATGALVSVARIAERIRVVAEHWRLRSTVEVDCEDAEIPDALYREIYFIVGEALANSARHGRATSVAARLICAPDLFTLVLEELDSANPASPAGVVPRSLDERIRDLGGSLSMTRGDMGYRLVVELPIHG